MGVGEDLPPNLTPISIHLPPYFAQWRARSYGETLRCVFPSNWHSNTPLSALNAQQIRDVVSSRFTVDKLKTIITAVNDECFAGISKTGKKQDLINRLSIWLDTLRNSNMGDKWQSARNIINSVRNNGK